MRHVYYGPEYGDAEIERELQASGVDYERLDEGRLIDCTAREIAGGKIVGWFQGRMEFGPRALGARSILGDARSAVMQSVLNLKVKHRESFWSIVYLPFMVRDLTRSDLRTLITRGLEQTSGNYKMLVELFNMDKADYKRFLNFLRKQDCQVPYAKFRALRPRDRILPDARLHRLRVQLEALGAGDGRAGPGQVGGCLTDVHLGHPAPEGAR